jgi:N-acetylglutamate synthase-like GNAT family acetyltransferase
MTPEIAKDVATLLNARNQLAVEYDAKKVLDHADRYIVRQDADSKVVGVVEIKKLQWYQCEIDHLSVAVDRCGIGSSLLVEALAKAKALGARIAQCTIRVGNTGSEALFAKHGFVPSVTFKNYETGNRVTVFHKALTP